MNYQEYLNKNKEIQNKILLFLDKEDDIEENYNNLIELFTNYKIKDKQHELKSLLHLISNICNNHYQLPSFRDKIERILEYLKESMKNNFTNQQIFDIFKNSKIIILILIEREIITFDQSILNIISSTKYFKRSYHQFFFPEIHPLIEKYEINIQNEETNCINENCNKKSIDLNDDEIINFSLYKTNNFKKIYKEFSNKLPDNFFEQRKIGQNENFICKLIREDSIDEFISYVNKNEYSLKSFIEKSIFETNDFLIEHDKTTLIEYAAFFGSTQIFKYLYKNGVEFTSSLWLYGIHSDNPEMIHLLEENEVKPPKESYKQCIKESIKCHHNDITNYIISNFIDNDIENINQINFETNYKENIYSYIFHYYNYSYFPEKMEHQIIFYYACEYDYIDIVEYFLKTKKVDINKKIIINLNSSNFKINPFYNVSPIKNAANNNNQEILNLLMNENKIENDFFKDCTKLREITIPSSIISIGSSAFHGCLSLTLITFEIPSSVTSIGLAAFNK